jgi:hypothetical protein
MQCGMIIGRVIKSGEPPPTPQYHQIAPGKRVLYGGFSGMSGKYQVVLSGAQSDGKSIQLRAADQHGLIAFSNADKGDGTYVLPFSYDGAAALGYDSASVDLWAEYRPKNNNINRQRVAKNTLVIRKGSARMKPAYLIDLDDAGYPDIFDDLNLAGSAVDLRHAVYLVATDAGAPAAWNRDRQRYSKMLCAVIDVRVSEGGISS